MWRCSVARTSARLRPSSLLVYCAYSHTAHNSRPHRDMRASMNLLSGAINLSLFAPERA